MEQLFPGVVTVIIVYTLCVVLHRVLPAQVITGYCCDNKTLQPLQYRINGIPCLIAVMILFYILHSSTRRYLYDHYYSVLFSANAVGLCGSALLFFVGGKEKYLRCVTVDQLKDPLKIKEDKFSTGWLARFYLGSLWNPRPFGADLKMLLYLLGAIMLHLVILSAAQVYYDAHNHSLSNALMVYLACFTWFLVEYTYCEHVHLYTYDLFAEKVGFKLTWGCLVFYPFFYPVGVHTLVTPGASAGDISVSCAVAIAALFLAGWGMTRGANMQKYYFRTQPECKTFLFGLVTQRTIPGTHILCSGWWGVARHFNYFGEIVQGLALALPGVLVGASWYWRLLPLLYPLYYIALFVPRQIDDDVVCKSKYGGKWDAYVKAVPYRIVPGVW